MTIKEKLLQEFEASISATFGSRENDEYETDEVSASDIDYIAHKVKFYMDL